MSRLTQGRFKALPVRGCHPLWPAFPNGSGCLINRHWPGPRSLATTSGVSVDILSSGYLDVSVPRVRFGPSMYSKIQYLLLTICYAQPISQLARQNKLSKVGSPIRTSADQSLFAAPHGFSQRTTSFITSQRQGIHRTPLRHLITLTVDAHPSAEAAQVGTQTQRTRRQSVSEDQTAKPRSSRYSKTPSLRKDQFFTSRSAR